MTIWPRKLGGTDARAGKATQCPSGMAAPYIKIRACSDLLPGKSLHVADDAIFARNHADVRRVMRRFGGMFAEFGESSRHEAGDGKISENVHRIRGIFAS